MISTTTAILAVLGFVTVAWIAMRDHGALRRSRRVLLDDVVAAFDGSQISHGRDDFPSLDAKHTGARIHVALIPDTMTIRRLPQLWASVTRFEALQGVPEFAVLIRPAGTEFYSLTSNFDHRLETPPGLPDEVLIRGGSAEAQRLLDQTAPVIAEICADARVKEVGVTTKGLRLVWQAGEGRRGEHLLLRQSLFDDANIRPSDLMQKLDLLAVLSASLAGATKAVSI